jgi:hypothetical protein
MRSRNIFDGRPCAGASTGTATTPLSCFVDHPQLRVKWDAHARRPARTGNPWWQNVRTLWLASGRAPASSTEHTSVQLVREHGVRTVGSAELDHGYAINPSLAVLHLVVLDYNRSEDVVRRDIAA